MKVLGWDRSTSVKEGYPGIDQLRFEHECTLEVRKLKAKSPAGSTIWVGGGEKLAGEASLPPDLREHVCVQHSLRRGFSFFRHYGPFQKCDR